MRRVGVLWVASTSVAVEVFKRMDFHAWGQYLRERTSADKELARQLGQEVRGA